MNNPGEGREMTRDQMMSALFANMIVQQTNMAFMFLGRVPHPETGEVMRDMESAQYFIDQLEMLEVKTKGNLGKEEEGLLKQSLTGLRMAFVEAMEGGGGETPARPAPPEPPSAGAQRGPLPEEAPAASSRIVSSGEDRSGNSDDESRKKFSKKY